MNFCNKIVNEIPLKQIWNYEGFIDLKRIKYINLIEIKELLNQYPVEFVIADIGKKLKWISIENCYDHWVNEIKKHIAYDYDIINIEEYPESYAFIASIWKNEKQSIILLEKYH